MIVDSKTGRPAEPVVVDRESSRPLRAPHFMVSPGPAAVEPPAVGWRAAAGCWRPTRKPRWSPPMSIAIGAPALRLPDFSLAPADRAAMNPRTWGLLHGPIVPTLLSWPGQHPGDGRPGFHRPGGNLVGVAPRHRRLGGHGAGVPRIHDDADAVRWSRGRRHLLAIARALGAGRRTDADALVLYAILINGILGLVFSAVFLLFGPQLYSSMGGKAGPWTPRCAIPTWSSRRQAGLADECAGKRPSRTGNMMVPSAPSASARLAGPAVAGPDLRLWPDTAMGIAGGGVAV